MTTAPTTPTPDPAPEGHRVHMLHGKPLSECSCDELSAEGIAGEGLAAIGDGWSPEQDERLKAVWGAFDAKPQAEKDAFEAYWEKHA